MEVRSAKNKKYINITLKKHQMSDISVTAHGLTHHGNATVQILTQERVHQPHAKNNHQNYI